jgi:hypothetical protein
MEHPAGGFVNRDCQTPTCKYQKISARGFNNFRRAKVAMREPILAEASHL